MLVPILDSVRHGLTATLVWVNHMKTTVDISDPIFVKAKRLAARKQITLKALIESALRDAIEASERSPRAAELETHVVSGNGLRPGRSWDELIDLSYEGRGG